MILWSDLAWATHKGLGLCRCGPLPRRTGATEPVRFQRAVRVCAVSLQGTAPVGIRRVRARGAGPRGRVLGAPRQCDGQTYRMPRAGGAGRGAPPRATGRGRARPGFRSAARRVPYGHRPRQGRVTIPRFTRLTGRGHNTAIRFPAPRHPARVRDTLRARGGRAGRGRPGRAVSAPGAPRLPDPPDLPRSAHPRAPRAPRRPAGSAPRGRWPRSGRAGRHPGGAAGTGRARGPRSGGRGQGLPARTGWFPAPPFVWGLRLWPPAGGIDEAAELLGAAPGPVRAAFVLHRLDGLAEEDVTRLLGAAGAAGPEEAVREARAVAPGAPLPAALLNPGFDASVVSARPTDLLRRRRRVRAAWAAAVVAVLVAGVLVAGGSPPRGQAVPAAGAVAAGVLDPARLARVPAEAWADTARVDFTAWPARGGRTADRALLTRALGAWAARPGGVRTTAAPGTTADPPAHPPHLLYAGDVPGDPGATAVVLLLDAEGDRVARYTESAGGRAERGPSTSPAPTRRASPPPPPSPSPEPPTARPRATCSRPGSPPPEPATCSAPPTPPGPSRSPPTGSPPRSPYRVGAGAAARGPSSNSPPPPASWRSTPSS